MVRNIKHVFICMAIVFCCAVTASAASRHEVANKLEGYRQFFVDFQYAPDSGIPGDLLAECHGVMIMRQYKAGFMFGVKGGEGVLFLHDRATGEWSPPAFLRTAEGSFGFQIGGQSIDAIILIMNQEGVDMLLKSRFMIGVDASAAAGPVGRDVSAQVGPGTALLTYARSKGLYAGASFQGGAVLNNDAYNRAMYGEPIEVKDIIFRRDIPTPAEAIPMINTLKTYSVHSSALSSPAAAYVEPVPATAPVEAMAVDPNAPIENYSLEQRQAMLDEEARQAAALAEDAARRAAEGRARLEAAQ